MKTVLLSLLLFSFVFISNIVQAQNIGQATSAEAAMRDSSIVEQTHYYKTAEIAYEVERVNRYIKESNRKIDSRGDITEIDTLFTNLSAHIKTEFEEFGTFNKQTLSKYFLLNTKKVWLSYRSQLVNWQADVSGRIQDLMEVSEEVKLKESLWSRTALLPGNEVLPDEIKARISTSLAKLNDLEIHLFDAVGILSVLDSKITDQILEVDEYTAIIDELHQNYRETLFKSTQPVIWKLNLRDTTLTDTILVETTAIDTTTVSTKAVLKKVWYENTKSIKDSLPSFKEYWNDFILWSILIILVIAGLRYLYLKQNPGSNAPDKKDIKEIAIQSPVPSALFLIVFVFILRFNHIPLLVQGLITMVAVFYTYLLLRKYVAKQGSQLILTFFVLMIANIVEIVFWYFGDYARIYLLFESGLGILLVSRFLTKNFEEHMSEFRYQKVVRLLRYPVFILFVISFFANVFGYQNITVLFLKIATQMSSYIIIILGAWEICHSCLFVFFELAGSSKKITSLKYYSLIETRLKWLLSLFFGLVWFHSFLVVSELDAPFYEALTRTMEHERKIGSFVFTYDAIFQFCTIILITWFINALIKVFFNEGNFKKKQTLRGVPGAISTTLRLIIGLGGFFLALSGAGIDLSKISLMVGAFGVGIGFGLQNIVNNFISGLILVYERPIQVGDIIEIDVLMGTVKDIGIRSSTVRTFEGAEVVVPNSILVSNQLVNWTLSDDRRRLEINVGVKYGTDVQKVLDLLKEVAYKHPLVFKEPKPIILFDNFGDSSLNFRLLCWIIFNDGFQTRTELTMAIDKIFHENGIEIPFPQRDLHLIETPESKAKKHVDPTPEPELKATKRTASTKQTNKTAEAKQTDKTEGAKQAKQTRQTKQGKQNKQDKP